MAADRRSTLKNFVRKTGLVAVGLAVPLALFAMIEWQARERLPARTAPWAGQEYAQLLLFAETPAFRAKKIDGTMCWLTTRPGAYGDVHARYPVERPAGTKRIIVLGESSAGKLARAMDSVAKDGRLPVEIMNCSLGGGSLPQMEKCFDDALRYSPEAIVFLFGHNLMFNHPRIDPNLLRLDLLVRRSRAMTFLLDERIGRGHGKIPDPRLEELIAAMERLLRRMAAETKKRGIALAVATLPANLRWEPRWTPEERRHPEYLRAVSLHQASRKSEALRVLLELADKRPSAPWHYQAAEWLEERGDHQAAYRQFWKAADLDGSNRVNSRVNPMIRRVVKEEGALLLDLQSLVEERSPRRVPGRESFEDSCHVHDRVARWEAAEALKRLGHAPR